MKDQSQIVREEVRTLISKSCDYEANGTHFYPFHKELLKFFFESIEVIIDYDQKIVHLWNSKPLNDKALKLYDINQAVSEKVNYTNLEETLKGCVETGEPQTRFYKNLLHKYQTSNNSNNDSDYMSA